MSEMMVGIGIILLAAGVILFFTQENDKRW